MKILIKQEKNRRYNYTSARLRTKGLADFTYGRFEARMKLLHGQGLWPAFWMLSSNEHRGGWPQSGEIDIMEFLGQDPKKVFGTVHYGDPYPNNKYQGKDFFLYDDETFADDFHVFAVEWEPGTYSVTLTVTDDDGATDSTAQDVSVSSGGDPTTLHVQSILTGTENAGGGKKRGTATITIHDDLEAPVGGATVFATFSGTFNEAASAQTGPDGTVTLTTAGSARSGVIVNLCVDNVTHATLSYDSAQNDITCSGGNLRLPLRYRQEPMY